MAAMNLVSLITTCLDLNYRVRGGAGEKRFNILGSVSEVTHLSQELWNYRQVGGVLFLQIEDPNLTVIVIVVKTIETRTNKILLFDCCNQKPPPWYPNHPCTEYHSAVLSWTSLI